MRLRVQSKENGFFLRGFGRFRRFRGIFGVWFRCRGVCGMIGLGNRLDVAVDGDFCGGHLVREGFECGG